VTARRLLFAAVVLLSVVVLFTPSSRTPTLLPGLDKVVHLGLFATLALTGRLAGLPRAGLALGLAAYAGMSEVLQALLPLGRTADVRDAAADLVGVALGLAVWCCARARLAGS
jgi:VanZ family protein